MILGLAIAIAYAAFAAIAVGFFVVGAAGDAPDDDDRAASLAEFFPVHKNGDKL